MLAHLFQTFCVLSHLFQQVLLFLIVRIRALFKLLEARSILLRFQPLRCPSSSVNLETRASPPSLARTRPTREKVLARFPSRASSSPSSPPRIASRDTRARARAHPRIVQLANSRAHLRRGLSTGPSSHRATRRARAIFFFRVALASTRARRRVARARRRDVRGARALLFHPRAGVDGEGRARRRRRDISARASGERKAREKGARKRREPTGVMRAGAQIFFAAARAVLEIFVVGTLGAVAATRGWLDAKTARALATFNGNFFLPALLWTSLSRSVSVGRLREMWLLPVECAFHVVAGLAAGVVVARATRAKPGFRTVTVMSCGFGNSLALPVVVARAVTRNPNVGTLTFTEADGDRCVLYLSAYVFVLSGAMWSVGPWLFRRRIAAKASLEDCESESGGGTGESGSRVSRTQSFSEKALDFSRTFFNPNIVACVAGVLTGIATPARDILFNPGRALSWIGASAQLLADAAIPTVLLVIGASLSKGPDYSMVNRNTALAIIAVRFVVIPFLTIGAYYALRGAGVAPSGSDSAGEDPIFWMIFLLVGSTPTANNMMLQAHMCHDDERAAAGVGTLLFWQYLACPFLLTAFVSWHLVMIDR